MTERLARVDMGRGGGVKKCQNFVDVFYEWPLSNE